MAEREDLLAIRNEILNRPVGDSLFAFMHDYVTSNSVGSLDAIEIKGMCRLIQAIKEIPKNC